MSKVSRGIAFELRVAKEMEAMGFVVGSRRHIGGAGDLLGIHPDGRTWLVECKDSTSPYHNFSKAKRRAMNATLLPKNSFRFLVHKRDGRLNWIGEKQWP